MKTHALTASLILALLTACGGRSSSPPDLPSDKPAEDKPNTPSSPSTVTLNLSDIVLPPNTVERPVPDEQKQIDEALKLTNELRAEKGLQPLRYNESLAAYATQRAKELVTLNAHKRPNGDNPLDNRYLPGNGLVGENIAASKAEAAETMAQWRNSPNHYKSITDPGYTHIGIGYLYQRGSQYRHYWAQILGSNGVNSIYHFIAPLNPTIIRNAVNQVANYDGSGHLSLSGMQHSNVTNTRGGRYRSAPYLNLGNEHTLILRPYQAAGWSYQTFGEVASTTGGVPEAYLNIGKPYIPADNVTLRAEYRGNAIGDLAQERRTYADVTALVDYSNTNKTLSISFTNSQSSELDGSNLRQDNRLNFNDTLHWDNTAQRFQSNSGKAHLYGPNGEELGGQFNRSINQEAYRGAYGAKRVQ